MTSDHLLPANATRLEQALSLATDSLSRLALPVDAIRQFKTDPSDPLLPWLIWEYGLGELLPYLPQPRQAIAEGILWQRLRGTPAALSTALAWIGIHARIEQEPPGVHFAEFQLDPGRVLDTDQTIADVRAVASLSAPARSRLARLYHGHDLRRLQLDHSVLGEALLSDDSGVRHPDHDTRLSFGRTHLVQPQAGPWVVALGHAPHHGVQVHRLDRWLLDAGQLSGEPPVRNHPGVHSHLRGLANAEGVPWHGTLRPARTFVRAQVVLSDGPSLGDTQACLPASHWQETGSPLHLSEHRLSETRWQLHPVPILERLEQRHGARGWVHWARPVRALHARSHATHHLQGPLRLGWLRLSEPGPTEAVHSTYQSLPLVQATYAGQAWIGRWSGQSWRTRNSLIGSTHRTLVEGP